MTITHRWMPKSKERWTIRYDDSEIATLKKDMRRELPKRAFGKKTQWAYSPGYVVIERVHQRKNV